MIESWHAKQSFLTLIWESLYSTHSSRDVGTLYHLRQAIHRNNVTANPKKDVEACEQFMLSVTRAYLVVAALDFFGIETVSDKPTKCVPPQGPLSEATKRAYIQSTVRAFIAQFAPLHPNLARTFITSDAETQVQSTDKVANYSHQVIELGLILMQLIDTAKEGDGERSIRNWKIITFYFKSRSTHSKYALEGIHFISQVRALLSPRKAHEVIWSQFCSSQGGPGRNLSCDLRMEHYNNEMKKATNAMGANKTPEAVQRISKASTALEATGKQMDKTSFVPKCSSAHSYKSTAGDEHAMINIVKDLKPYIHDSREHSKFRNVTYSTLDTMDKTQIASWIAKAQNKFSKHPIYRGITRQLTHLYCMHMYP